MKHYKFIPYSEYSEFEMVMEDGVEVKRYLSPYWHSHPHARVSGDNMEVVLSCSNHDETCTCVTREEALAHIEANWPIEETEV